MKKVYLLLTLFMTSFFFVSLNKVRAATIEYTIDEADFDYINDTFFKLRELTIDFCNENNTSYMISMYTDDSGNSFPVSYVFNKTAEIYGSVSSKIGGRENRVPYFVQPSKYTVYSLSSDFLSLVELFSDSYQVWQYRTDNTSSAKFTLKYIMDTDILKTSFTSTELFIFYYNNLTYNLHNDKKSFPTLYQVYLDAGFTPEEPDKFEDEKELINNFYSTIFTKISELTTNLSNNYTFLLIFTIFIFIFVIELTRRYLL